MGPQEFDWTLGVCGLLGAISHVTPLSPTLMVVRVAPRPFTLSLSS